MDASTAGPLGPPEPGGTAVSPRSAQPPNHARDLKRQVASGSLAWAEMVLRAQEMPPQEILVVLTTADRELVRRHLDLHLERLEEWLSTQRRSVAAVERILAGRSGAAPGRDQASRSQDGSMTRCGRSR